MTKRYNVIRCPIHGTLELNDREMRLIDHPVVQRIRHISQLAFASLVYPSAVHSRFSHSLGSLHLAGVLFDRLCEHGNPPLQELFPREYLEHLRQIVRFAALLHDVGHPPFSHTFENNLPLIEELRLSQQSNTPAGQRARHEDFSVLLIDYMANDPKSEMSTEEAEAVCELILGRPQENSVFCRQGIDMFPLCLHLINAEIDADRMDYLLRDSYFAGVMYGGFDSKHIIRSLHSDLDQQSGAICLALESGGIIAYENFLLSRSHMFIQVYFHKVLPGFEHYLKRALEEELELCIDADPERYLQLQEHKVYQELHRNAHKFWAQKIISREPMKVLVRKVQPSPAEFEAHQSTCAVLAEHGIEVIAPHSFNTYSSQTELSPEDPRSIRVIEKSMGKRLYSTVAQRSQLLCTAPAKIEISQLCVMRDQAQRAISILGG